MGQRVTSVLRYFRINRQRVGRESAVGIATRYELDGPGIESRWGARFSTPVLTGPAAHPASYTIGTGFSLAGVKRQGRGCPPTPFSAEVKEKVHLYLYSPSGPSRPALGRTLLLPADRGALASHSMKKQNKYPDLSRSFSPVPGDVRF
jgi:hypothetical protein